MIRYQKNRLLSTLGTFGIGGPAKLFCDVHNVAEMQQVLHDSAHERLLLIGRGSNLLFDDFGFDGLVVEMRIDYFKQTEQVIEVGAGFSFARLGAKTARARLSGLEFASGIPGSVGGAVVMNAGACGQETASTLLWVEVLTSGGEMRRYQPCMLDWGYRSSSFQTSGEIVTAACFALSEGEEVRQRQLELLAYKRTSQPLQELSAGCIFRNPPGLAAGELIERCGLKGLSIGKARISPLHANFIINEGGATARDVLALMDHVKQRVREESGIELLEEVRFIAKDGPRVSR